MLRLYLGEGRGKPGFAKQSSYQNSSAQTKENLLVLANLRKET